MAYEKVTPDNIASELPKSKAESTAPAAANKEITPANVMDQIKQRTMAQPLSRMTDPARHDE